MFLSKKYFIYYHRVSTQEGLNIDLNTSEFMLGNYNKEIYQKCNYCHCVIEKENDFKENPFICNFCFKLIQNDNKINKNIEFSQTFIDLIWIKYLQQETSKINAEKFHKKLLQIF